MTRFPSIAGRALLAGALLTLAVAACTGGDAVRVQLTASPSSDPLQRELTVRAQVTGSPAGLRYKWFSIAGQTEPQESAEPATVFTFADAAWKDRVTLEAWRDDRVVARSEIDVALDSAVVLARMANTPPVEITVTTVPPYNPNGGTDTRADIAGRISGSQASSYRVVVYARADLWYRQPSANSWVEVAPDGTWKTWTHTGASYAAFAVRRDIGLSPRLDVLPQTNGNIVGRVIVEGVRK